MIQVLSFLSDDIASWAPPEGLAGHGLSTTALSSRLDKYFSIQDHMTTCMRINTNTLSLVCVV